MAQGPVLCVDHVNILVKRMQFSADKQKSSDVERNRVVGSHSKIAEILGIVLRAPNGILG